MRFQKVLFMGDEELFLVGVSDWIKTYNMPLEGEVYILANPDGKRIFAHPNSVVKTSEYITYEIRPDWAYI